MINDIPPGPDPEEEWRAQGWNSEWTFSARSPGGEQLLLKWRSPLDVTRVDVRAIREDAPAGSVAQTVRQLARVFATPRDVAAVGIEHRVARASAPELYVFATVTVAVHDVASAARAATNDAAPTFLQLNTPGGRYPSSRTLTRTPAPVVANRPPIDVLTIRYVARTPYGHLALVVATPQMELAQLLPGLDTMATGFWLEAAA